MANFFNQNQRAASKEQMYVSRYNAARSNLLLVVVLTVFNIIMLLTESNTYFLFSASIPYLLVDLGMLLCGKYPKEFYTGDFANMRYLDSSFLGVMVAIAFVILAIYLLCFVFSRKQRVGWLIAALVLFSADTLIMFVNYGIALDMLVDMIFHVIIIVCLAMGVHASFKIKQIQDTKEAEGDFQIGGEGLAEPKQDLPNSTVLRLADYNVKSRTFLETNAFNRTITYRRVKKTNELVIDGNVYAEYVALLERPHMLTANIDGHAVAVGYDGMSSYIMIDGQTACSKVRMI